MLKWSGSAATRPLSLAGTRQPRPFRGVTPIRGVRRPVGFTRREIAGAIGWALLMGGMFWSLTVLALSAGPVGR